MRRIHWRSLAGNILYCEFLDNEQENIYQYMGNSYISRFSQYGLLDINIDESQLNNGQLYIKNLEFITVNGRYISFNESLYTLSLDLDVNMSSISVYISLTDELDIANSTILTLNKEPVNLPVYLNKLCISNIRIANSILLLTILKNDYGVYTIQYNNCIKCSTNLYNLINNLNINMYKYVNYVKNSEINKLPMLNMLYIMSGNLRYIYDVNLIYMELNKIYSVLMGYDMEIVTFIPYNHENNIQICENIIKLIIKLINKQIKSNMLMFQKQDTYYSVLITNNITKLEIILEPLNEDNRKWIDSMRIASKSKLLQVRNLRNIGIERSIETINNSSLIISLNMNSEWLIMNEELCIDMPINNDIIINNLMIRISE